MYFTTKSKNWFLRLIRDSFFSNSFISFSVLPIDWYCKVLISVFIFMNCFFLDWYSYRIRKISFTSSLSIIRFLFRLNFWIFWLLSLILSFYSLSPFYSALFIIVKDLWNIFWLKIPNFCQYSNIFFIFRISF